MNSVWSITSTAPVRASSAALAAWSASSANGNGTRIAGRPITGELGHRRGAGARDHEMRVGDALRQILEERLDVGARIPMRE